MTFNGSRKLGIFAGVLSLSAIALSCQGLGQLASKSTLGSGGCQIASTQFQASTSVGVNNSGGGGSVAQSFTPSSTLNAVDKADLALSVYNSLGAASTLTGNLNLYLQTDSGGSPSGTTLLFANLETSQIGTSPQFYEFDFNGSVNLTANQRYWLVLEASYAANTENYVTWNGTTSSQGGAYYLPVGSGAPVTSWLKATVGTGSAATPLSLAYRVGCP